jgi:hypothetical protein
MRGRGSCRDLVLAGTTIWLHKCTVGQQSAPALSPLPVGPCPLQILGNLQQQMDAIEAMSAGPWLEQQHLTAMANFKACVQVGRRRGQGHAHVPPC